MKIDVIIIIVDVAIFETYYEIIQINTTIVSVVVVIDLKQIIFNNIIIYNETSNIQTKIIEIVIVYFNI